MGQVTEVDLDKLSTLSHYKEVLADAEVYRHEGIKSKVETVMGNAELAGDDQDLICQLLVEDDVCDALMNIVANCTGGNDPSMQEAKYTVGAVNDFIHALENRLYAHLSD